ncbi:ubiquitin thiolesterase [Trichoderma arundinaceum]|uniref:ubiquitinyl hydrolase 1 n=1 Tax=Trichoderma arundinaceum TaxID=490622 RepID=A0A395NCH8_TRIAR|nr:ubiquitin thiolesterase [Trichoderma arundinaceum]
MDGWSEKGRQAAREAFNHAWEIIDRELQEELERRTAFYRAANNDMLENNTAVIETLESENRNLRTELADMSSRLATTNSSTPVEHEATAGGSAPTPSIAISLAANTPPPSSSEAQNTELIKFKMRFNALSENFKKAKEALRKRKDERDWWKERAMTLERQAKAAEEKHGIRILEQEEADKPDVIRSVKLTPDGKASAFEIMPPPAIQTTPDGGHTANVDDVQLQSTQGDPDEAESEDLPPLPANDEYQDQVVIKDEPSSDIPVVVSERTLKRRRVEDDRDSIAAIPRIKAEPNDSSPIAASEHYQFNIQESIDLDDIAQKITTPRKRKDLEVSAKEDEREEVRTTSHSTAKLDYARVDGQQQSAKNIRAASVLTPISGNKRITKWAVDEKKARSVRDKLGHAISTLAEDGTPYGQQRVEKGSKAKQTPNPVAQGRLDELLNSPTPENMSMISRTPQARQSGRTSAEDVPLGLVFPEPRELPFDKIMRQTKKRQSLGTDLTTPSKRPDKKAPGRDKSPQKSRGSASALRHKPLSELRLDDFKINPLSNDGHDFAYSEVVRDKDDRAGLRGCTDMHCCGKHFRALALSQRPNPPLTAAQRQEEQRLLENYLGEFSYKLASMTKDERDETWIKAKTEELANKYGRHRHRYSRMQSPPGFWNADFPDTQELAADKEEALKREKRAIADRYREAMRSGELSIPAARSPPPRTRPAVQVDAGVAALGDTRNSTIPQAGRMSNRHLPAGQNIQAAAGGINGGMDLNGSMGGGPRRRQPQQYMAPYHQHQHQHPQHMNHMYSNYAPYAPQQYYSMPPHQYQAGGVPAPGYMSYQNYTRSPPPMQQFAPMVGVSIPPSYPRAVPQSPNPATPYQPPLAPAPGLPHTPSSTHSSQPLPTPTPTTPQTPQSVQPVPAPPPVQETAPVAIVEPREPFRPPLPWLSRPDLEFPLRTARSKRQRKLLVAEDKAVSLPVGQHDVTVEHVNQEPTSSAQSEPSKHSPEQEGDSSTVSDHTGASKPSDGQTVAKAPATTDAPATRSAAPAIPVVPVLPKHGPKPSASDKLTTTDQENTKGDDANPNDQDAAAAASAELDTNGTNDPPSPVVRAPPTSWANLFARPSARAPINGSGLNGSTGGDDVNGDSTDAAAGANNFPGSAFSKSNANSLAEAIQSYRVESNDKLDFLEPRGLINTGNMCYMNSVLQVLMFCVPFYDLLDQVGKKAVHSFKSETPLIDALIMFMREYKVLKSSASVEQLNRVLKNEDLERYGEPFTPEFVYDAIRQLSRFASMRRGHQQDAEEFLGFLLQSLDDECTHVMKDLPIGQEEVPSSDTSTGGSVAASDDWLEVGRKQRAAVSRLSGHNTSTPITKIFGGLLRSEFRVPGLKDSITTERYQPLQLDIGSPDVRNVVDALRGLTRPERLQGDFNSPRGKDVVATKQVFIESLPPVLILHLKRFQFDAEGHGTVKIWKKIGYPLELEIPREALSRQKRQNLDDGSMPRYKLISVVYHHGKNASGGHYTVDVRRQDGREWIRLDDTVIRRIRPEDVAETGSEEDPKEGRKDAAPNASSNRFGGMNDEDTGDEDGWKQVTAPTNGGKRWSNVVNGGANGAVKEKQVKDSIKDNKVAYLLFYQRI